MSISLDVSVMGVSQTPLLLALVRRDLDLDAILKHLVDKMGYVDDLSTAAELEALQQELLPSPEPLWPDWQYSSTETWSWTWAGQHW